jgi:hypothetical protein
MHLNPFTPGETVSAATSTSTQAIALGKPSPGPGGVSRVCRVCVPAGADLVFIRFGDSTVTAAASGAGAGVPIIPGAAAEYFTVGPGVTHMAAIAAANTPTVYATNGYGS